MVSCVVTPLQVPGWANGNAGDWWPPTNMQDYADFMAFLAARYKGRPNTYWEIWNEPNDQTFWKTSTGHNDPAGYTHMVLAAYSAIKAVDPAQTVLAGAIVFNDQPFLAGMYTAGVQGHFDALSIHPYDQGQDPTYTGGDPWFNFAAGVPQVHQTMVNLDGHSGLPTPRASMGASTRSPSTTRPCRPSASRRTTTRQRQPRRPRRRRYPQPERQPKRPCRLRRPPPSHSRWAARPFLVRPRHRRGERGRTERLLSRVSVAAAAFRMSV